MSKALNVVLVFLISMFITACKLAVIVVEGGEVQSTGSGTCVAGVVCIVEVTDTGFSDSFRAVPNADWYFHKWSSGEGFLCGGSADPECILSFEGAENNAAITALVESTQIFYLMPVFKQTPHEVMVPVDQPVRVDGNEWLQPIHFVNYSYDEINQVCPARMCAGRLPGSTIDLTGYVWASSEDVQSLFDSYEEKGRNILNDFIYTLAEIDVELDQAVNLNLLVILGDEPTSEGWLYVAGVYDGQPFEPSVEERGIGVSPFLSKESSGSDQGAWFWRLL